MAQSLQKNIRATAERWDRIEETARERDVSSNQLVIELVIEALNRREWPRMEAEIKVAKASLFAAQVLAATSSRTAASRKPRRSANSSPRSCATPTPRRLPRR